VKPLDPRLLRYSAAARGYLAVTVGLGLAGTGLILVQAGLLAHLLASAATGTGAAVLAGSLAALLAVLLARAAASCGADSPITRSGWGRPGWPGTGPARSPRWPPGAWTGWMPTSPGTSRSSCWPPWSRSPC